MVRSTSYSLSHCVSRSASFLNVEARFMETQNHMAGEQEKPGFSLSGYMTPKPCSLHSSQELMADRND